MKYIDTKNREYWNWRAEGYSDVNKEELEGIQRKTWPELLDREIMNHFSEKNLSRDRIKVLDIGTGPGFIAIVLAEIGYDVTAVDFSEAMLDEARSNAKDLAKKISFRTENAMDLSFSDKSFDVIVTRNLTWNLPKPEKAYEEWIRVLKDDGFLMIFDANWYDFLIDKDKKQAFENDREKVKESGIEDYTIGENFDVMDKIALGLPLTGKKRPDWDKKVFLNMKVSGVETTENIGNIVYSEKEKVNYASTPMFMIKVRK